MSRAALFATALMSSLGMAACSSSGSANPSASEASPLSDDGGGVVTCDMPTQTYMANMSQKGAMGALTFVLVSVNGDAPAVGIDTWEIKLLDASGHPVNGATITVKVFMPEHNHGSSGETVKPTGDGTYEVDGLNLFMSGIFQITLTATAGSVTDSTVFTFCLGG